MAHRNNFGLALSLLLAAATASAAPARYQLDPEHLTVAFLVQHIGYARTLGQFQSAAGEFHFDEQTGELADLRVTVDTASVTTGHAGRDNHVRGSDFLDVKRYPQLVFSASRARRTGEKTFVIEGTLEMLGRKLPLELQAQVNKSAAYPIGDKAFVMGVSARGTLRRSDFGMRYGVANGLVGDEVELLIEAEARRR
jgi:polyisoprenoid-binding protein YceI